MKSICAVILTAAALLPVLPACGPRTADKPRRPALPDECPAAADRGDIRWIRNHAADERSEQLRWCAAVGPPLIWAPPGPAPPERVDSLAVVCWNTHVGGGAVNYLLRQLRTGVLTSGKPVDHFVVLLQEVFRAGEGVPPVPPAGAYYADEIFPSRELGERIDIAEIGRTNGLYTYYVPSMRNGEGIDRPEDRGNAILSTLPLEGFSAWELPIRTERRVAVGAAVSATTSAGERWRLALTNVHLDLRTNIRSIVRSFSGVRRRQIAFIMDNLPGDGAGLMAGDFNTWLGEKKEPAILRVREDFPLPRRVPSHGTLKLGPILERQTDYIFFRLPQHWRAGYRRIDDTYGSDHYPLLGWIVFGTDPGGGGMN